MRHPIDPMLPNSATQSFKRLLHPPAPDPRPWWKRALLAMFDFYTWGER